ncbi:MAG TPA: tripartite tricarboxylate transporter TctB family protein [Usitatibacter sp.]|nr:tripartite tricarboxylate transporter TctB family protein [Usitatibacter sp.]
MKARLAELVPYAALLAGAAYLYHDAASFAGLGRPGQLGPDFWPKAVLILLMIVCGIEIVRRALAPAAAAVPAPEAGPQPQAEEAQRHGHLLAGGIVLTILYVPGIAYLGFFLATALFLAAFMYVGRYRRARIVAAASVLGSLAFVFVFMKVVYVSLPLGAGPFRNLSAWIMAALGIH